MLPNLELGSAEQHPNRHAPQIDPQSRPIYDSRLSLGAMWVVHYSPKGLAVCFLSHLQILEDLVDDWGLGEKGSSYWGDKVVVEIEFDIRGLFKRKIRLI